MVDFRKELDRRNILGDKTQTNPCTWIGGNFHRTRNLKPWGAQSSAEVRLLCWYKRDRFATDSSENTSGSGVRRETGIGAPTIAASGPIKTSKNETGDCAWGGVRRSSDVAA